MSQRFLQGKLRPDEYRDSGTLMRLARALEGRPGVRRAAAIMCTPRNLDTLGRMGLAPPGWASPPKPDDLFIVVEAESTAQATEALDAIDALLAARTQGTGGAREGLTPDAPRTLAEGLAALPEARLALVSVPGAFAAREARRALEAGLDVMVFSNGVSVEEEVRLKTLAAEKGRLVMGPDCGTALLDGVPLGFANAVRRGAVGVVGASGSGMQEFTCLVHQRGAGVSHAIGTGGRDLRAEVGGRTALAALARLADDPATRVVAIVSKPPAPAVADVVLDAAVATGRPVVACFLGPHDLPARAGVTFAHTLEDAARHAAALAGHSLPAPLSEAPAAPVWAPEQRLLRALFVGGTLGYEALTLLAPTLPLGSNLRFEGVAETLSFRHPGHLVLDMGEEEFTRGRPHPMIDPTLRNTALRVAAEDPQTAVILLDLVLGTGAHPDPAGDLVPVLRAVRAKAASRGHSLALVASVTGTDDDPQPRAAQVAALVAEGVEVLPSNAAAVRRAAQLLPKTTP